MERHYAKTGRQPGDSKIPPGPKRLRVSVQEKECGRCGVVKPAREFHKHAQTRDGLNTRCKPCAVAVAAEWQKANPEQALKHQWTNRLIEYGITQDQYDALAQRAGGMCELCGKVADLVIDHCHTSGVVRGLLCNRCNFRMALFDNKGFLKRAALYVLRAKKAAIGLHVDVKRRRM